MGRGQGNSGNAPVVAPRRSQVETTETIAEAIDRAIQHADCSYVRSSDGTFPGWDVYEPIFVADLSDEMKEAVIDALYAAKTDVSMDLPPSGQNKIIVELSGGYESESGPYRERFSFVLQD